MSRIKNAARDPSCVTFDRIAGYYQCGCGEYFSTEQSWRKHAYPSQPEMPDDLPHELKSLFSGFLAAHRQQFGGGEK